MRPRPLERLCWGGAVAAVAALAWVGGHAQQEARPPGNDKSPRTRALEAGARLLQQQAPLRPMDVYLVGFHPLKEHPQQQMEAPFLPPDERGFCAVRLVRRQWTEGAAQWH